MVTCEGVIPPSPRTGLRVIVVYLLLAVALCKPLNSTDSAYDPQISRHFASFSSATYCDNVTRLEEWSCGACLEAATPLVPGKIKVIDGGQFFNASRVIVGKLKDQHGCLVAFRGTNNLRNWITDFEVWQTHPVSFQACVGCKVHAGFYDTWNKLKPSVLEALNQVGCGLHAPAGTNPDKLLYVTGHSLGASLAHLAMFTLQSHGWDISKTYSYEAPRTGNRAFSEAFAGRFARKFPVFRVTHAQDPIVHLPLVAMGYYHVQTEVFYDAKGNYTVCKGAEDPSCADQYWWTPEMTVLHKHDHCGSSLVPNENLCTPVC